MTLTELIEQARQLAHRGHRLQETTFRLGLTTEEATAEIEELKADPSPSAKAYRLLGKAQHQADIKRLADEKRRTLTPRMNLHYYESEHLHNQIVRALSEFIEEAQQPPTIEAAFRRYTKSLGVSADQILLLALTEQVTTSNLRATVPTMRPSQRLALYQRAQQSPFDPVNAVTIRYLEETDHPYSEAGPLPESESTAAASLGRAKKEARAARVPAEEVAEVEKVLSDVGVLIKTAARLGAIPLNPQHPGNEVIAAEIESAEEREAQEAGA